MPKKSNNGQSKKSPAAKSSPSRAAVASSTPVRNTPIPKAVGKPAASSGPARKEVTYQDIARRAYEIYEREGRQPGTELQNWLKSEAELGVDKSH